MQGGSAVIFATVGAQMPFDRLISTLDQWAGLRSRRDVFAQIGDSELSPANIEWVRMLSPPEFREKVQSATALVAHAGMGSILTALEYGKPILVMPRRGDLRETRNDHQVATAKRFLEQGRVHVAMDQEELLKALDTVDRQAGAQRISPYASEELVSAIREFIHAGRA